MTSEELINYLIEAKRKTLRDFFPRRILTPTGFRNPDRLYEELTLGIKSVITRGIGGSITFDDLELITGYTLGKYGHPMFFLDNELIERLSNTDLPKDLRFNELDLPHQAFSFAVPIDWGIRKYGVELQFISIVNGVGISDDPETPELAPFLAGIGMVRAKDGILYQYKFNTLSNRTVHSFSDGSMPKFTEDRFRDDSDSFITWKMIELACQVILYMNTIRDSIPKDVIHRPAKHSDRKGKSRDELWSPNILKWTSDKIGSHESVCGGISPRTHWRRGHFRAQRCGNGLKDVRTIWIQPVLVNKDKSDPNTFST